jgi:hypothetical protein
MNTMNMPGFTAENAIYKSTGHYCMVTAFDARNASANVQPAVPRQVCKQMMGAAVDAWRDDDSGWSNFWVGAWKGAGCAEHY